MTVMVISWCITSLCQSGYAFIFDTEIMVAPLSQPIRVGVPIKPTNTGQDGWRVTNFSSNFTILPAKLISRIENNLEKIVICQKVSKVHKVCQSVLAFVW